MCTAATYQAKDFYFGRTLDNERSFGERVTVLPRSYPLAFRHTEPVARHYAIIGMTAGESLSGSYPLFYDGVNEKGLCMAGLNFVDNAVYRRPAAGKRSLAQFEFVPWILATCASVAEARAALATLCLTDTPFSPCIPPAELHWLIADRHEAITVESVAEGLMVYDNPVGVMTNNPPFPMQMQRLTCYRNLTPQEPANRFSDNIDLAADCKGLGAVGLPGDWSSASRFVRAAFAKLNAVSGTSEEECVGQFFHILGAVEFPRGCCVLADGTYELTQYTSCCNAARGIYYYTTYENRQITAVDLYGVDLEGGTAVHYPLVTAQQILRQN